MPKDPFEDYTIEYALKHTESSLSGISEAEAARRISKYGNNEIKERKKSNILKFISKFYGPIPMILWLIIIITYLIGNLQDMYVISALLVFNAIVSFAEEYKADRSIELLKSRLSINSKVLRSSEWKLIPSRMLVRGDIIRVRAGDIVPADSKVISGSEIEADQSVVTGESLPSIKKIGDVIYSGTIIRKGEATCLVYATGYSSLYGKTAKLVQYAKSKSHLQSEIFGVVKYLIGIDIAVIIALFLYGIASIHMPLGNLVVFLLVVFVASVPVALPAAFTVSFALGTEKLAKKFVLVTKLSAIEEIAIMDLLCMDKTGTITENNITVKDILGTGCKANDVIRYAAEASRHEDNDPIDNAILDHAKSMHIGLGAQVRFTPFDPSIKRTEAVIMQGKSTYKVAKGAPAVIFGICHPSSEELRKLNTSVSRFSKNGYRTLAVAATNQKGKWEVKGIIALYDRPRKDSASLISDLLSLGISIKMITGDNVPVATEIAKEVGIGSKIVDMGKINLVNGKEGIKEAIAADGFAGVYPEDKYNLVKALQDNGYVVGMTGDGVNDAPALKQAEVGIAVENATDVAKNSATMVLTQSGIRVIVDAVKESRMIFQRMLTYTTVKVARVMQILSFIFIIFIAYGFIPITALLLIMLIFTNDIVNLAIATDNAHYSINPDLWNIRGIFKSAAVFAMPLVVEAVLLVPVGLGIFHATVPELETAGFLMLNVSEQFTVFSAREKSWFFKSAPSLPLIVSSTASVIVALTISYLGILTHAVNPGLIAFILATAFVFFIICDVLKVSLGKAAITKIKPKTGKG